MGFAYLFYLCVKHRVKYLKWLSLLGLCYQLLLEISFVPQLYRFASVLSPLTDVLFIILVLLAFAFVLFRRTEDNND